MFRINIKSAIIKCPIFVCKRCKTQLPNKNLSYGTNLYVVIGSKNKILDSDIEEAVKWVRCGAKVVTTCPDIADPGAKGDNALMMPNHILHIIKRLIPCTSYCVGKPNPIMIKKAIDILSKDNNIKTEEILFVGIHWTQILKPLLSSV